MIGRSARSGWKGGRLTGETVRYPAPPIWRLAELTNLVFGSDLRRHFPEAKVQAHKYIDATGGTHVPPVARRPPPAARPWEERRGAAMERWRETEWAREREPCEPPQLTASFVPGCLSSDPTSDDSLLSSALATLLAVGERGTGSRGALLIHLFF